MPNYEEEFFKLLELTDNIFYVPTEYHSSGFNRVELIEQEEGLYIIEVEGGQLFEQPSYSFNEIKHLYPEFIFDREEAFFGNFITWDYFEKIIRGEKKHTLVYL